jgi:hypothetical protein
VNRTALLLAVITVLALVVLALLWSASPETCHHIDDLVKPCEVAK